MTTMIALVGDQPLPNFLPVLHHKPNKVLLVYSDRTQKTYEYLKIALEKRKITIYGLKTDPYDILASVKALNKELNENVPLAAESLIINLTGGTKPMSLAAYQVAAQRNVSVIYMQSEKGQTLDYYTWQDHQLLHQKREDLADSLQLQDILELQLGPEKDSKGKMVWQTNNSVEDSQGGHLFELAITQALNDNGYEAICGINDRYLNMQIDVMIRYQNQVGIIEAKTGNPQGIYGLRQLINNKQHLGGTYIKQFLVKDGNPSNNQIVVCEALKIGTISLLHYQRGMTSLTSEDINILLKEIDKVMKAGTLKP